MRSKPCGHSGVGRLLARVGQGHGLGRGLRRGLAAGLMAAVLPHAISPVFSASAAPWFNGANPEAPGFDQPANQPGTYDLITGRDFAGLKWPLNPAGGPLSFAAQKVWAWTEEPDAAGHGLQRLLLDGEVEVDLGLYHFTAKRAVVWLSPRPEIGPNAYQVFALFDRAGSATDDAVISFNAERLPVRGVINASEPVRIVRPALFKSQRPSDPLLVEGERTLAAALRSMVAPTPANTPDLPTRPGGVETLPLDEGDPDAPGRNLSAAPTPTDAEIRDALRNLPPALEAPQPIFAKNGIISVSSSDVTLVSGADRNSVIVSGGVVVQYTDLAKGNSLQMTAQRAVIFLPPGPLKNLGRLDASEVLGVYLEGDMVATDGKYTLRAPKAYYDVQTGKAVVIDSVFWTYDQQRRLPLYVRAETIRQQSQQEFVAEHATLTNTAFFDPMFSIGASNITITQQKRAAGEPGRSTQTLVDARNITLRAGPLPFFYFPVFSGDPEQIPLRDLRVENSSGSGSAIKTVWDIPGILGVDRPEGFGAELLADVYLERGPAIGTQLEWNDLDSTGSLLAYTIIKDDGTDVLKPGTEVERESDTRGIVAADHIQNLDESWKIYLEGSYISDESFVDAFMESMGENRREFTNRAYLRRAEDNSILAFDAKGTFNDFIANEYLLQSQGYSVEKMPEGSYVRLADDLAGGAVSYFSEYRAGQIAMNFDDPLAKDRGFNNYFLAQRAFGINADQSISERLRTAGLEEGSVTRLDTRHEFVAPLMLGDWNLTPSLAGRATHYDDSFDQYSPADDDHTRLWGSPGAQFSTTLQHIDNSVDSRALDLHRVRHLVTPSLGVWAIGTNVDNVDLPVYDDTVEGIAEGSIATLGLDQVWQTQRGGPARWHSVDVFKLRTDLTITSDDANIESPISRTIFYRPELSNVGDSFTAEGEWLVTDSFSLVGSEIYSLEYNQPARTSGGFTIQHWPGFGSYMEYRGINALDSKFLDLGTQYELTSKYALGADAVLDLTNGGLQTISFEIRPRFPSAIFGVGVSFNDTTDETSFGFIFQPVGVRGPGARLSGVGASDPRARTNRMGG